MKKKLLSRLISLLIAGVFAWMMFPLSAFASEPLYTIGTTSDGMSMVIKLTNGSTYTVTPSETDKNSYIVQGDGQEYTVVKTKNGGGEDAYIIQSKNGQKYTAIPREDGQSVEVKIGNGNTYIITPDANGTYTIESNGQKMTGVPSGDLVQKITEIETAEAVEAAVGAFAVFGVAVVAITVYFLMNPDVWLTVRNTVRGWVGMERLEPELPTEGDFWLTVSNTLRGWFGMESLPYKPASAVEKKSTEEEELTQTAGETTDMAEMVETK